MPSQAARQIKPTVAANIKAARVKAGLTQRQLGALVNDVDAMAVSRWERGYVMPSVDNLMALAAALGRDPSWFYAAHKPSHKRAA